jgi:hypothetical protein
VKWSASLPLRPWVGAKPSGEYFSTEAPVLWLGGANVPNWLQDLQRELTQAGRLWCPALSTHRVPGAGSQGNPWAFRPDDYAPLRWGPPEEDIRDLMDVRDRPESISGLVLDGLLDGLGGQETRTLLTQAAALMGSGTPWLLLARNGGSVGEVAKNLRRADTDRGEGKETVRSAQEIRRFVEVAGLGVSAAWGLSSGRRRSLRRLLPGGSGWPLLLLEGRRVGVKEE